MFLEMSKQPSLFTTAEQRLFYKILNVINLDNFTFFTLTTNNTFNVKHVTFKRELFTWKVIQTSKATRGVLTWLSKPGVILSKTESIVKCDNGKFMSTAFILSESFNKKCSSFLIKLNVSLSRCQNDLKVHDQLILLPFFLLIEKNNVKLSNNKILIILKKVRKLNI